MIFTITLVSVTAYDPNTLRAALAVEALVESGHVTANVEVPFDYEQKQILSAVRQELERKVHVEQKVKRLKERASKLEGVEFNA